MVCDSIAEYLIYLSQYNTKKNESGKCVKISCNAKRYQK